MKITWDYQFVMPEDAYIILEEYWEDNQEWAVVEIIDPQWQTLISLKYPELCH